tara:strand:- start:17273 stop:18823 length:1551 start_codon:yes stop_codon:yes gene_type:complete
VKRSIYLKGAFLAYLKQFIQAIAGIILVPILIKNFGMEIYSSWVLIYGFAAYLSIISFGIPSAMMAMVAQERDIYEKFNILRKSFFLVAVLSSLALLSIFFLIIIPQNNPAAIFGTISLENKSIASDLFTLFLVITFIKLPFEIFPLFFSAMNLVYINQIYEIFISILLIACVTLVVTINLTIYQFAMIFLIGQLILFVISSFHIRSKWKDFLKRLDKKNKLPTTPYSKIFLRGWAFLQTGIAATIIWYSDNLVIGNFLSVEKVGPYALGFKIFAYFISLQVVMNSIVYPVYGKLISERNLDLVNKYISFILYVLPFYGLTVLTFFMLFSSEIILLWTNDINAYGGYLLFFSLGLYVYVISFSSSLSSLINAMGLTKKTVIPSWIEVFLNLSLSIIFLKFIGIGGVALASVLASIFSLIYAAIILTNQDGIDLNLKRRLKLDFLCFLLPLIIIWFISRFTEVISLKIFIFIAYCLYTLIIFLLNITSENKKILLKIFPQARFLKNNNFLKLFCQKS